MSKKMLIDATHPEETRVAVISGNRLEEYDYETLVRKQLKSNIYLVKVTRVEPSLQAAFVDFGGNRHGFLPFPEIHPDYYRIPIADREALLAEERAYAAAQAAKQDAEDAAELAALGEDVDLDIDSSDDSEHNEIESISANIVEEVTVDAYEPEQLGAIAEDIDIESVSTEETGAEDVSEESEQSAADTASEESASEDEDGEEEDNGSERPFRSSIKRKYKIQEVIKRNQIMLIQISKEERGNKGAAVTSYISLPGRYCVLMPNSPRGGGVSRKVSNAKDRQRLKKILHELNVPEGMSVILRTAGVSRSSAEIKRDLDYLLRLWNQIRELTLKSTAPALIYEEGNLIKRAIRDLYRRDIDEVHVAGETAFRTAKDFMRTLMPSHAERVFNYADTHAPLFGKYSVEKQIDEIHNPTVHLKSGGYIVINPTEAMVSIDVNSGKATKGRHIEETALKTNLEAADEIARQLRLRDQGGLVVIDFIDMEDNRNNRIVEKRLRDAMQSDRARIQLGRISPFGLLELSRQRLNPSLVETNFEVCKHCSGTGLTRTVETSAVIALRAIEEEALRGRSNEIKITVHTDIALYIFNHKRDMLAMLEQRHGVKIYIHADDGLIKPAYNIEGLRNQNQSQRPQRNAPVQTVDMSDLPDIPESEITDDSTVSEDDSAEDGNDRGDRGNAGFARDRNDRNNRKRGRRGGRRGRDRNDRGGNVNADQPQPSDAGLDVFVATEGGAQENTNTAPTEGGENQNSGQNRRERGGRRRGRRGGRDRNERGPRTSKQGENTGSDTAADGGKVNIPIREAGSSEKPSGSHSQETSFSPDNNNGEPSRKGWWKRLTE